MEFLVVSNDGAKSQKNARDVKLLPLRSFQFSQKVVTKVVGTVTWCPHPADNAKDTGKWGSILPFFGKLLASNVQGVVAKQNLKQPHAGTIDLESIQ